MEIIQVKRGEYSTKFGKQDFSGASALLPESYQNVWFKLIVVLNSNELRVQAREDLPFIWINEFEYWRLIFNSWGAFCIDCTKEDFNHFCDFFVSADDSDDSDDDIDRPVHQQITIWLLLARETNAGCNRYPPNILHQVASKYLLHKKVPGTLKIATDTYPPNLVHQVASKYKVLKGTRYPQNCRRYPQNILHQVASKKTAQIKYQVPGTL